MDSLKWRTGTKIVSFIELIWSFLAINFAAILIFKLIYVESSGLVIEWFIWPIVAIFALSTSVNFWGAVQLFKATESGQKANDCVKLCQNWRHVCIAIILRNMLLLLVAQTYMSPQTIQGYLIEMPILFFVAIHDVFLYVVNSFIKELKTIEMAHTQNV